MAAAAAAPARVFLSPYQLYCPTNDRLLVFARLREVLVAHGAVVDEQLDARTFSARAAIYSTTTGDHCVFNCALHAHSDGVTLLLLEKRRGSVGILVWVHKAVCAHLTKRVPEWDLASVKPYAPTSLRIGGGGGEFQRPPEAYDAFRRLLRSPFADVVSEGVSAFAPLFCQGVHCPDLLETWVGLLTSPPTFDAGVIVAATLDKCAETPCVQDALRAAAGVVRPFLEKATLEAGAPGATVEVRTLGTFAERLLPVVVVI